jgi:RNA polymerase sigma-70 factor (ECF subfamily)
MGLSGRMLLQESRRAARTSPDGDLILLEQQDRSLWNKDQIAEGVSLTERALRSRRFGAYTPQAAIAAVHAESCSVASTDWRQIMLLYDRLLDVQQGSSGCRTKPRRGRCHVRRSGAGSCSYR